MQDKRDKLKRLEEERNRAELEQFEKKFSKKKFKERKVTVGTIKSNKNWKMILISLTLAVAIITAVMVALCE